jgi:hypothetical protein
MKIRLNSRSIRFRLNSAELETLSLENPLREIIRLGVSPSDRLCFEVHVADALEQMSLQHSDGSVRILIPKAWLPEWRSGKKIGYEMKHSLGGDFEPLKIIVESDLE